MKFFIVFCLSAVLLGACSNNSHSISQRDTLTEVKSDTARNAFFPVADFLEAEIRSVDSVPLAKKKFTIRNGHTDSIFLELPEFNRLALQFVPQELADGSFEKNFTETSFQDQATRSITFTYAPAPNNPNTELQRVDVLTVPGNRSMEVKSVYLEKIHKSGDSVILQKMFWRAQRGFEIATLIHIKGIQAGEEQIRVVWDDSPEEE